MHKTTDRDHRDVKQICKSNLCEVFIEILGPKAIFSISFTAFSGNIGVLCILLDKGQVSQVAQRFPKVRVLHVSLLCNEQVPSLTGSNFIELLLSIESSQALNKI